MSDMYETDRILLGDPEYLEGLQHLVAGLSAEFPAKICRYHPEGGKPVDEKIVDGSFIHGAVFSVGPLGQGPTLSLDRTEIRACCRGVVPEVQRKIDEFVTSLKCFKLIWTSQNGMVEIEYGRYSSIPEATDDLPAAKARLDAEYPASVDFHYPHDIKAGTWRVVPAAPTLHPTTGKADISQRRV
jgi:hypothetical protein